jgi:sugar phosphate permease
MNSIWKLHNIFYGWWMVGASFLLFLLVGGFLMLGFTAFFEPIAEESGWSYTHISLAASLRGAEAAIFAPVIGLLIDRWGPRRLVFGGIVIIGLGLVLLSYTDSLAMFYVAFVLIAIGSSCSSSPTVLVTSIANWFRRRVGIATGIIVSGYAIGGLLIPLIVWLIDMFGWRNAILIVGLGISLIGLPLSLLFRHKPEQYGYLPDGEQYNNATIERKLAPAPATEVDIGAKQALKSRTFWHLAMAYTFQYLAISAVIVHIMPYLSSVSIARSTASLVATATPLISIIGRIGSGWLGDRYNKKMVAAGFITLSFLGMLFFSYIAVGGIWLLVPFVILFGIGWGGHATLRAAMLREYFGRSQFGTIHGFIMGIAALGGVAAPLLAGWVFDNWSNYFGAWLCFVCFNFAGVIIILTTPLVGAGGQLSDNRKVC